MTEVFMAYLNVNPMISALRSNPAAFEFTRGSLYHIPSGHRFQFDRAGQVHVDAQCSCSSLTVSEEQQATLFEAYGEWRVNYWQPIEINREFAAHFTPPSGWRRLLIELTAGLHRALLAGSQRTRAAGKIVPAE
jgi:hypothetical protein